MWYRFYVKDHFIKKPPLRFGVLTSDSNYGGLLAMMKIGETQGLNICVFVICNPFAFVVMLGLSQFGNNNL